MKTYSTRASEVMRSWHVLDATGVPLGRLATHVATLIRGKHKVNYSPHLDTGDYVVVVNAERVGLTGRKFEQKKYYRHSQYPGGLKVRTVREQMGRNATRVIEHAVFGMLPHNSLGRSIHGHLKVYAGPDHPHAAQVTGPAQPALSQPPKEGSRRKHWPVVARAVAPDAAPVQDTVGPVTIAGAAEAGIAAGSQPAAVPAEQEQTATNMEQAVPTTALPSEADETTEEPKA